MGDSIFNIISSVSTAAAALLSAISVLQLRSEKKQREKLEEMHLTITPKAKLSNCKDEIFFFKLAFSNESSLPISILELKLSVPGESAITNSKNGIGGMTLMEPVRVSESKTCYPDSDIVFHNSLSASLPITIAPFSSFSGYIAFHAGNQDSAILCNKNLLQLEVQTSRKNFEIEMHLSGDNFFDFSYSNDGKVSGNACK